MASLLNAERFLLARFHIQYLCQQTTTRKFLNALETLKNSSPSANSPLDPTYDRVMDSIRDQKSSSTMALKVLSWLVQTKRQLSVNEIRVGISVEQGRYNLDELDIPDRTTLLDICGGLVTINEASHTIQLAHQTVHEYLLKDVALLQDANFGLAVACTTYLTFDVFANGACHSHDSFIARFKSHPFLEYAAQNLAFHLQQCDQNLTTRIVLNLLKRSGCIESYMQALHDYISVNDKPSTIHNRYPKNRHPLHVATLLKHREVVQALFEQHDNCSEPDSSGENALHTAANNGDIEMVKLLLDQGIDFTLCDRFGHTPIQNAAWRGNIDVVRLLLERGADILTPDRKGQTTLYKAALRGDINVVRLLIDNGADLSTSDRDGWTVLHRAAKMGYEAVVRLLIEKGADLLALDNDGLTVLHAAVEGNQREIVQLLLESGIDSSIADSEGKTALNYAVSEGHEAVAELLERYLAQSW